MLKKRDVLITALTGNTCMSGLAVVSMLLMQYKIWSTSSITLLRKNMDVLGHDILYINAFRSNLKERKNDFSFLHFVVTAVYITTNIP